ncbi:hypothetical protein ACFXP7_01290 [Microbacterium sp. P06]|uniref:hypothetical protein n=1 Tax=Microbacterium sp. P06 TaxID=3366949 RepID=UPI003745CE21
MKRIDISYGGQSYSVGNRDIDDLLADILTRLAAAPAYWLEVNAGEGEPRSTQLLITAGVPLALTPIPGDEPEGGEANADSGQPAPAL